MVKVLRKITKAIAVGVGALVALAVFLFFLAYLVFSPSHDEVTRSVSPNGRIIATVIEVNGGATTSFGYDVRLQETDAFFRGARVASLYGAVRSASAYGVNLRWASDSELLIEYLSVKNAEVEITEWRSSDDVVRVTLRPGIEDASAPAGGMLYNIAVDRNGS